MRAPFSPIRFSFPTVCHQASTCLRHLPQSQPLTFLQATLYVKPGRRLPKMRFSLRPRSCQYLGNFSLRQLQHVLCGSVAEFGVLPTSLRTRFPAGDVWHGRNGISPNYDTHHPRRGGSPSEESAPCVFATRVCWTSTKRVSCRTETVAYPRRIRKAHRAPSTRSAFPFTAPSPSFPNSAAAAAARPAATHPRGSALHHLMSWRPPLCISGSHLASRHTYAPHRATSVASMQVHCRPLERGLIPHPRFSRNRTVTTPVPACQSTSLVCSPN